ncbi:hypothetical protein ACJJTC_004613 [Scirpophaga incertulas]
MSDTEELFNFIPMGESRIQQQPGQKTLGLAPKSKALSKEETKALLALIERSKIITSKATNATNNQLKNDEWNLLAERFNSTITSCPRTPQQLRLKWENLKKNSRKHYAKIRSNHLKTGGGPPDYIPLMIFCTE